MSQALVWRWLKHGAFFFKGTPAPIQPHGRERAGVFHSPSHHSGSCPAQSQFALPRAHPQTSPNDPRRGGDRGGLRVGRESELISEWQEEAFGG